MNVEAMRRWLWQPRSLAWLAVAVVAVVAAVFAASAERPPATAAQRAYELKQTTLCPVCDGQSVLESNAPAAAAMRRQIDVWVDAGRTDTEIRADLTRVYGDDVNALPPGDGVATLVWALPIALFAAAAAGLWIAIRRWQARTSTTSDQEHSPDADAPTERLKSPHDSPHDSAPNDGTQADAPGRGLPRTTSRRRLLVSAVTVGALAAVGVLAGVLVARSAGLRLAGETISGDIDRSARSLLVDAQRQFAANQLDEARATLEEVFRLDRDLRGAHLLSARLHLRRCETLAAQAAPQPQPQSQPQPQLQPQPQPQSPLKSSSSTGPSAPDDSTSPGGQSNTADPDGAVGAADAQGCDLTSALADLDRVLADNPSDSGALALRGWLLVRIPDTELAAAGIAALDAAVALAPAEFDPWVFRGYTARFLEQDPAAAISYYQAALERNPPPAMATALQNAITEMQAELRAADAP